MGFGIYVAEAKTPDCTVKIEVEAHSRERRWRERRGSHGENTKNSGIRRELAALATAQDASQNILQAVIETSDRVSQGAPTRASRI